MSSILYKKVFEKGYGVICTNREELKNLFNYLSRKKIVDDNGQNIFYTDYRIVRVDLNTIYYIDGGVLKTCRKDDIVKSYCTVDTDNNTVEYNDLLKGCYRIYGVEENVLDTTKFLKELYKYSKLGIRCSSWELRALEEYLIYNKIIDYTVEENEVYSVLVLTYNNKENKKRKEYDFSDLIDTSCIRMRHHKIEVDSKNELINFIRENKNIIQKRLDSHLGREKTIQLFFDLICNSEDLLMFTSKEKFIVVSHFILGHRICFRLEKEVFSNIVFVKESCIDEILEERELFNQEVLLVSKMD